VPLPVAWLDYSFPSVCRSSEVRSLGRWVASSGPQFRAIALDWKINRKQQEEQMIDRIIGVLRLDVNTYETIEHDPEALTEAAIIVAVVALLSGLGSAIGADNFIVGFLSTMLWAFIGWFIWAGVTYWVGTSLFEGEADLNEMLRVLGYAQAPGILRVLTFIPCVGWIIGLVAWIWSLVTAFIAVRQGLDVDNSKALLTVLVGWFVVFIGSLVIGIFFGGIALGLGALTGG
jgi:hypothetical protein